jgi:acetyl esterase/lipase
VAVVPIGYLASAALLAWCTACAVAPRRSPSLAGWLSFAFGFTINELPHVGAYWLIAATALAFSEGDVSGFVGWLAFGLSGLAMAGLALCAVRSTRAAFVIDRALDDGLGVGWRNALDPQTSAGLRPTFSLGLVSFLPLRARSGEVIREADIAYGDAGPSNTLDVYVHRARPADGPALVHLHGGALRTGRKNRDGLALIYRLASQGWMCVSANYRLAPTATFPDHLIDAKKVIAWVRTHGAKYGADPSVLVVAGASSGAQLASLAALTPNDPLYQPGFESADTSVTAAVALYGLHGSRSVPGLDGSDLSSTLPVSHVRPDAPPFFVSHGDLDTLLRVEGARDFVDALRAVSRRPVVYAEMPGAQHAFDRFRSVRCDNLVIGVEHFAAWLRSSVGTLPT